MALLAPHLDVAGAKCVLALERIPLPPPHSPEEKALKSALGALMQRLWTRPIAHPAEVARLTEACIAHFQTRFLGADTFVFGQFIHTNVVLGKGAEGTVYLGFQLPSLGGQPVAIKKIDKTALLRSAAFEESLDRQCEFLSKTDHPSIVKLYAVEKLESCWYCYYEFLDGGDLDSFLTKRDATPQPGKGSKVNKIKVILSEAKAKEIFRKLVRPVDYLRQNAVIHRDLKPHNFMLTRAGEVKLVDFATMREAMDVGDMAQSIKGTPAYMAPEIWNRERRYEGEKVDVWSMGVILYEMVCGALPWQGDTIPDHLKNVRSRPLAIPASLGLSKELCELLTNVLKVNSDVRMSWAELISHDWLVEDPLSSHVVGNFLEERAAQLELELERLKAKCKVLSTGSEQKDLVIQNLSHQLKEDAEKQEEKDRMIQSLSRELQEEKEARQRDRESASGNEAQVKQAADQLEAFRAEAAAKEAALKDKVLMSTQQVVQLRERIDLAEKEKNEAVDAIRRQLTEALASNHDLSSQLGKRIVLSQSSLSLYSSQFSFLAILQASSNPAMLRLSRLCRPSRLACSS